MNTAAACFDRGASADARDAALNVTLLNLPQGAPAVVTALLPPRSDDERDVVLRLAELGFLPGERVRVISRMSRRGPVAVRVGERTTFALREHEAELLRVQPTEE